MATLNFDFHPPSGRPSAAGMALALVGSLALAASLFGWQQASEAHDARSRDVAALELAQQKRAPVRARANRNRATPDIAELAKARIRTSLDYSWQPAFAALQATQSARVALVALEASQSKSQVRITAEARRLADAVEYANRLDQQPGVARTALLQHQVQEKDAQRPVRFTLVMEMRR